MNNYKGLNDTRAVSQLIIDDKINNNKFGYNPITRKIDLDIDSPADLTSF